MNNFHKKMTWVFFLGILILSSLVVFQPADAAAKIRKFYVTEDSHTGGTALLACDQGFHMASIWEILDVSNLKYDTGRGLTSSDSGFGPPTEISGWIRTGFSSDFGNPGPAGRVNCDGWTSSEPSDDGTHVRLESELDSAPASVIDPWSAAIQSCDESISIHVWCVEN